ncbi:MAG: hypothetical protein HY042_09105, partial [Spirochaetia bacterium]|nr:hypothetical protein [Spirochaetia bacterium]
MAGSVALTGQVKGAGPIPGIDTIQRAFDPDFKPPDTKKQDETKKDDKPEDKKDPAKKDDKPPEKKDDK